jgi:hypothetical protein
MNGGWRKVDTPSIERVNDFSAVVLKLWSDNQPEVQTGARCRPAPNEDRTPTHSYAATREAAMSAFAAAALGAL